MNSKVLLVHHPNNRDEAEQLCQALRDPLREGGVLLSCVGTAQARPLRSQGYREVIGIIAMAGADGSVPWDSDGAISAARVSASTSIVPILMSGESDLNMPGPIRERSVVAFEVSLSDAVSLVRLASAILQLRRSGFSRSLPEETANALFESTIRFYEENAAKFIDLHEEEIPRAQMAQIFSFVSHVERRRPSRGKSRVLDAGCGPGHHARFFAKCGFTSLGLDCCSRFVQHAAAVSTGDCSFIEGDMRKLGSYFSNDDRFDGIWANASCLHLPRNAVAETLNQFRKLLCPRGVLGISFQLGVSMVQREGRFFERYEAGELHEMLRHHRFTVIETLEDQATKSTTGRERTKQWLSFLALPA